APDADRHQHGLDPVVTKTVWPAELVQHHVLRTQARLDHLVVPSPADSQHALEHQKVFDNLMEMASGVFASRLVHQAQAELSWFERVDRRFWGSRRHRCSASGRALILGSRGFRERRPSRNSYLYADR